MGNIPLSADDIAFLKEKGNKKNSTQDIKNAFKEFAQDIGDAENKKMDEVKLNFEQFCQKADTVFNTESETLGPLNKDTVYQHLFNAFDSDKDGFVDFKEFAMGLLILGGNSASLDLEDETLDFVFRLHDGNLDGNISKNEAEKLWVLFKPKPKVADDSDSFSCWFNYVDENQDGFITVEEFRKKGKKRIQDIRRNSAFLI